MAHNLEIERHRNYNALFLNVWWDENYQVHTEWPILYLHNSEVNFQRGSPGGRFRFYDHTLRTNKVTMRCGPSLKTFEEHLEWIAEEILSDWSFDVVPDEPIEIGGPFGMRTCYFDLNFYFEDVDEAVLFKLKFT